MFKSIYFLVDGGPALGLARRYAASRLELHRANKAFAASVGADEFMMLSDGSLWGLQFKGERPATFKAPDKHGACRPKKGTEEAKRMADLPKPIDIVSEICDLFSVPVCLNYECRSAGTFAAMKRIGRPLDECGFAYCTPDGPFLMWVPDVEAAIEALREEYPSEDFKLTGVAANYTGVFHGCRRIEIEEWDVLVAQHKLKLKQNASAAPLEGE